MPVQIELLDTQFDNVIRQIKRSAIDRVKILRDSTFNTLKRLKVKRDLSKAVKGIPKGSDQGNMGDVRQWLKRIKPGDKRAISQLVAIDATAVVRTSE